MGHRQDVGTGPGTEAEAPRFGILGPLQVLDRQGAALPLGGRRPRELLAVLLLHPNRTLSSDRLVTALWGPDASEGAATTLRTHVATVRRLVDRAATGASLSTGAGGYSLSMDLRHLDAEIFEALVHRGQEALALGQAAQASALLDEALAMWRGDPLSDLGPPDFAISAVSRLEELHVVATESAVAAELELGRHREVVGRLQELVAAHPFRERLSAQLVLALYRSGRQADALAAYTATRDRLAEELGLDVGPELRDLETAILRHDPVLLPARSEAQASAHEGRGATTRTRPPLDAVFEALLRSPVVGRDDSITAVDSLWGRARDGRPAVLTLSGPAGIGKSRLAAHLAGRARDQGATVIVGRCDERVPYAPLAAALAGSPVVQEVVADAPDAVRAGLRPLLPWATSDDGGTLAPADVRRAADRQGLARAATWLLGELAADSGLLLVVEDAERLDEATSELLVRLLVSLPPRALVVLCHRDPPGTRHPPLARLLGDSAVGGLATRLALSALDRVALRDLVESTARAGTSVADSLVDQLWDRTGGNPLFATELVRDLDSAGLQDGRLGRGLPEGIRDVVRHRWLSLDETTRETVAAAAVLDREVEFGRLCRVLDLSEGQVVAALDEASASGFLIQGGQSWATDYSFPHELMREAVYAEIPLPRRQRLHRRAVDAILAAPTTDADVVAAAVHACEAGPATDPEAAAELVGRAARLAAATFGYEEAVRLAEARLLLLRRFSTPAELADAAVSVARLRLQSGRGYDRVVELLEEALATYLTLGDTETAGLAHSRLGGVLVVPQPGMDVTRSLEHFAAAERLLADPADSFPLHRGRMSAAMHALDSTALGEAADRCAELAVKAGRPTLAAAAGWGRGWRALDLGRPDDALHLLDEAWASVRDFGDPLLGWPAANAGAMICTVYLLDPRAGRAWCRQGLGHPRFDALVHPHDALVDQLVLALLESGEIEDAVRTVDALPRAAVGRRLLRFRLGEWEQAAQEWRAALDHDLAVGDLHDAVASARWLADALLALDREADARQVLQLALDISAAAPQVPSEVWLRARLASLEGTPADEADEHLARCAGLMDPGQDWRGLAGEVALATAAVALRRDDAEQAAAAASEAATVFSAYRLPWRRTAALQLGSDVARRAGDHDWADTLAQEARGLLDGMGAHPRWHRPTDLNATSTPTPHG